eukprot:1182929-Amorphochlora_amoeboformis.AAC.1
MSQHDAPLMFIRRPYSSNLAPSSIYKRVTPLAPIRTREGFTSKLEGLFDDEEAIAFTKWLWEDLAPRFKEQASTNQPEGFENNDENPAVEKKREGDVLASIGVDDDEDDEDKDEEGHGGGGGPRESGRKEADNQLDKSGVVDRRDKGRKEQRGREGRERETDTGRRRDREKGNPCNFDHEM